jgi:hypothetical protein
VTTATTTSTGNRNSEIAVGDAGEEREAREHLRRLGVAGHGEDRPQERQDDVDLARPEAGAVDFGGPVDLARDRGG